MQTLRAELFGGDGRRVVELPPNNIAVSLTFSLCLLRRDDVTAFLQSRSSLRWKSSTVEMKLHKVEVRKWRKTDNKRSKMGQSTMR